MKLLLLIIISAHSFAAFSQKLPTSWSKEFRLYLSTSGGMKDESIEINFTHDSCKYLERNGTIKKIVTFGLTAAMRDRVMAKMKEYKLDQIREQKITLKKRDEAIDMICYYTSKEYCLSRGGGTEIVKEYQSEFTAAYAYLLDFAQKKGKN